MTSVTGGPGTVGEPLALTAGASDAEQSAASLSYAWALSAGGSASGSAITLTPTVPGALTATVTVTDDGGCKASLERRVDVRPDTTAPVVRAAGVEAGRAAGAAALRVRFTLSEAGPVQLKLQRLKGGRRVGGRCVAKGRGKPCVRRVPVKSATVAGVAGVNRVALLKALKLKRLAPGRYRVEVLVRDAAGNRAQVAVVAFTVRR